MKDLLDKAESLIGHAVEITPLRSRGYVVEYFNFNTPPPPVGRTEKEALELFINFITENQHAADDPGDKESREEIERASGAEG